MRKDDPSGHCARSARINWWENWIGGISVCKKSAVMRTGSDNTWACVWPSKETVWISIEWVPVIPNWFAILLSMTECCAWVSGAANAIRGVPEECIPDPNDGCTTKATRLINWGPSKRDGGIVGTTGGCHPHASIFEFFWLEGLPPFFCCLLLLRPEARRTWRTRVLTALFAKDQGLEGEAVWFAPGWEGLTSFRSGHWFA